jgi:hypothetical protein
MGRGCWLALLALGGCSFRVAPVALEPAPDLAIDDLAGEPDFSSAPDQMSDLTQTAPDLATPDLAPAVTPILTVMRVNSPANVDLTAEGMLDWEAYGLNSAGDVNRKNNVTRSITHSSLGTAAQYIFFSSAFSWSDGTPTMSTTNTNHGIYITGTDNGFTWVVPAGTTQHTLRLYVGEYRGTGTLVAHLSDGSIADGVSSDTNKNGINLSRFEVVFRATTTGTLTVSWHLTNDNTTGASDFLAATYF